MKLETGMQGIQGRKMQALFGGILVLLYLCGMGANSALAVPPQIVNTAVSAVAGTTATFEADINPQGKVTRYHFEFGAAGPCETNSCASIPLPEGELSAGSSPLHVGLGVEGLTPGTIYYFRAVAKNGETTKGQDRVFATYSAPSTGLPDARAYEQASPVNKNGGDAVGEQALVKAADDGEGITFGSTFGVPGGVGAQGLPLYLSGRQGGVGWSTQGLFPPADLGERAVVLGWLPSYAETFANATKLGNPRTKALFALSTTGKAPVMVSPYVVDAEYAYAGTSADASTVAFESEAKLPGTPTAIDGASNVYAWDRAAGTLRLVSIFNSGVSPSKGAFAGPYDWSRGTKASSLREGGGASAYYLKEERAVTASGDVYFTAAVTGQLYLRLNPTKEQSSLDGEGKCISPALACTIQVSASQKNNGQGPDGTDPAGPQPAAFQAASADGSKAFFTSSEKLTDDANTGLEQPAAAIGLGGMDGDIEDATFIPTHALGVVTDSEHIYWADPSNGDIGRADIDGSEGSVAPAFISPGPIECEIQGGEPGELEEVPSKPRYVAVDAGHIYWTNSGCPDENERPGINGGTIGRADIDGTEASIEPEFITGASDPQGIAINATHIYWANKREPAAIGRADIDGDPGSVNQVFAKPGGSQFPIGVALSPTHVYFTVVSGETESGGAFVSRRPLAGGAEEFVFIANTSKLRGITVDAANVYWTAQGEGAIGRIPIADFPLSGSCEEIPSCDKDRTSVEGALNGLSSDAAHLYWSVNGEAPTNPGNDLYRYEPNSAEPGETGTLTDLTADDAGNGAEVQGVVGTSADGSRVYFVANAVLDDAEEATPGTCQGTIATISGSCNLYLWEEGGITFVARLKGSGQGVTSDTANWTGTAVGVFGSSGSYAAKSARTSDDGATLLFRSTEKLSEYDNEDVPELYRFRVGDPIGIRCVSCLPSGEAVGASPSLGSIIFPGMGPTTSASTASRNLSADGNRVFFETADALAPADTNGQGGCPLSGSTVQKYPACLDVYEWTAPGSGACKEGSEAYSPLNGGCLYLISTGKSEFPSLFADASASGNDVFFFTRQSLVGQDKDELQDVYDARVGGGLASQNPPPPNPCMGPDSCRGPIPPAPAEPAAGSATFVGPGDPLPKHKKQKAKKRTSKKHKKHHKKQKRAAAERRAGR